MTKMPPCPYMVKTVEHLLLQNYWADCHETWYIALVVRVNDNLIKLLPWIYLDLINEGQVNLLYEKK